MFIIATQFITNSTLPLLIPICFMAMANGAIYPIVANHSLSEFKENSTSAAGLMNFLQMVLYVIASRFVSSYSEYDVVAMIRVT